MMAVLTEREFACVNSIKDQINLTILFRFFSSPHKKGPDSYFKTRLPIYLLSFTGFYLVSSVPI